MKVKNSVILPKTINSLGKLRVSGCVRAPREVKVLLRIESKAPPKQKPEGFITTTAGGWYKYLPSTGNYESFSIETEIDPNIHGTPTVFIERWQGQGDIDIIINDMENYKKVTFWGSREILMHLHSAIKNPIEVFPSDGSIVTYSFNNSVSTIKRAKELWEKRKLSRASYLDISKEYPALLDFIDRGALIVDGKMLTQSILSSTAGLFANNQDVRKTELVDFPFEILQPGTEKHADCLRNSIIEIMYRIFPYSLYVAIEDKSNVGNICDEPTGRELKIQEQLGNNISKYLKWISLNCSPEKGPLFMDLELSEAQHLGEIICPLISKGKEKTAIEIQPIQLVEPFPVELIYPLSKFKIKFKTIASKTIIERSVLVCFKLKTNDGELIGTETSVPGLYRSKNPEIGHFRYVDVQPGYKGNELRINLPEKTFCTEVVIYPYRKNIPDVYINKVEILEVLA